MNNTLLSARRDPAKSRTKKTKLGLDITIDRRVGLTDAALHFPSTRGVSFVLGPTLPIMSSCQKPPCQIIMTRDMVT